jgi:hypothetical protein
MFSGLVPQDSDTEDQSVPPGEDDDWRAGIQGTLAVAQARKQTCTSYMEKTKKNCILDNIFCFGRGFF